MITKQYFQLLKSFSFALFLLTSECSFSQECRAVTDCSSGRCILTTICGGSNTNQQSQNFISAPVPELGSVDIRAEKPDQNGMTLLRGAIRSKSNIIEIQLNGRPLEVRPDNLGNFQVQRMTALGSNEYQLLVVDEFGRSTIAKTTVFRASELVAYTKERRVALIIGNSNYKEGKLLNPSNDANDFSMVMSRAGFDVDDLRDASISSMRAAVRKFGDALKKADAGVFYFAGHAVEVKGRNYLIPVGADIRREDEIADQALDVTAVLEKIDTAKKPSLVILDACRNNPFVRSFRTSGSGLSSIEIPTGTLIAFSTSPGKVAADGNGRNSPFTKHLVQQLLVPNMPIEQVMKTVRRNVIEETRGQQVPWENTSLTADFIIVKGEIK